MFGGQASVYVVLVLAKEPHSRGSMDGNRATEQRRESKSNGDEAVHRDKVLVQTRDPGA